MAKNGCSLTKLRYENSHGYAFKHAGTTALLQRLGKRPEYCSATQVIGSPRASLLSAKYPCCAGKSSSSQNRTLCKISRTLHDSAATTTLICGAHLEQGECEDGVVVAAQVRRQLVGPGEAQQQVGGHEVVVKRPLEEQLAAQHRLGHAAPPLACRTVALSTVYL